MMENLSVNSKEQAFIKKIREGGFTNQLIDTVIFSRENIVKQYAQIAESVRKNQLSIPKKYAQEIMGKNFLCHKDILACFSEYIPGEEQMASLKEVPFNSLTLEEESKKDNVLMINPGFTIREIRKSYKPFYDNDFWYRDESFTDELKKPGWQLLSKDYLKDSTSKSWNQQQALLKNNIEVPDSQTVVFAIILHWVNFKEILFEDVSVRTRSLDFNGNHVTVRVSKGKDNGWRIFIGHPKNDFYSPKVALAYQIKSKSNPESF
jgi:hypothetical protein